ncbi:MAG: hypothetical protein ACI84K_001441 [Pseudohongiellaceae bacterium]|jgi:hypothetical protein
MQSSKALVDMDNLLTRDLKQIDRKHHGHFLIKTFQTKMAKQK